MSVLQKLEETNSRIYKWEKAQTEAPSVEDVEKKQHIMVQAEKEYKTAVVKRALVYGWSSVGEEIGVMPRVLHRWHMEECPELEDVSHIFKKEMDRRERLLTKLAKRKMEAEKEAAILQEFMEKETQQGEPE